MTQLENLLNTGKTPATSEVGPLSKLLIVFFAATVSLALPAIALAQQSAKPGQQTEGSIKTRVAKTNMNKEENRMNQPGTATELESARPTAADAIRPFPKINISQEAIDKLRRRIADTQWPEKETVADSSQGVPLATAGLAGWMLVHSGFTKWTYGKDPKQSPTRDDVLDNFSLYWLTNTAASSARIYWENRGVSLISAGDQKSAEIKVPVAITVFPNEVVRAQERWARRAFPNLIYFHEVDRGGHFAAWEYPELFAEEVRIAFRSLR